MDKLIRNMFKTIVIAAIVITLAFTVIYTTPEYSLLTLKRDLKAEGITGIASHFTGNALTIYNAAIAMLKSPLARFATKQSGAGSMLSVLSGEVEYSVQKTSQNGDEAGFCVTLSCGSTTMTAGMDMVRVDGEWLISGISF